MPRLEIERCQTPYCRGVKQDGNFCHKCRKRKRKKNDPVGYAFQVLKNNAKSKKRNKIFTLTLEQFKSFISENDYMALKGKTKTALQIDCKKPWLGYTYENIRTITTSVNARKARKEYNPGGGRIPNTDYDYTKDPADPDFVPF